MAVFKVTLAGRWSEEGGWTEMVGVQPGSVSGSSVAGDDDDEANEEEMSNE